MGFGMEMLIMVALVVFILTGGVSIVLTVWLIKTFGPMYKAMGKQMKEMYGSKDEEMDEVTIQEELNKAIWRN